jgi:glycosyltransferase involved in cell wall biosynthesis
MVLSVFSGDLWAGAEVMIFTLLRGLREAGRPSLLALGLNEGVLTERLRAAGIETLTIPETTSSFPAIVARAASALRGRRIRIVHSHRYKENVLALMLAPLLGVERLISTVHGLPEHPPAGAGRRLRASARGALNRGVLRRRFSHVVAVSHAVKRALVEQHGFEEGRVRVIHNGVPLEGARPARPALPGTDVHVGTVGRLVPVKDYGLFLDCAARLAARYPHVRFSILGDGPERARLFFRARDLGLGHRVRFLGACVDPSGFYASLDLYVNTSRHEGLPLSVLEAMAAGLPVVAPAVGGLGEAVEHGQTGLLLDERTPEAFALACGSLVEDVTRRVRLGARGAQRAQERFSAGAMVAAYQELYA